MSKNGKSGDEIFINIVDTNDIDRDVLAVKCVVCASGDKTNGYIIIICHQFCKCDSIDHISSAQKNIAVMNSSSKKDKYTFKNN